MEINLYTNKKYHLRNTLNVISGALTDEIEKACIVRSATNSQYQAEGKTFTQRHFFASQTSEKY